MIWIILCKIWCLFCVIWWGYCITGSYKLFNELPKDSVDRDRVSVGILAEVILFITSIIRIITI